MQELFKAVRSHSDATTWSKGVELSRQGSVLGKSWKEEEILLLVLINEKSINPQVTLWPHEEDWNCDCGSQLDPCEHVAAAVIAIHQAQKSGKQLPQSDMEISTIEYHFSSQEDQQLAFKRLACNPHYCEALVVDLTALKSGRVKGPNIAPSKIDITIDYLIDGHRKGGVFPAHLMSSLIKSLRDSHNVYLDGKKISCDQNELRAPVKIKDHIGGILVTIESDKNIDKMYKNGVALCNNKTTLQVVKKPKLERDFLRSLVQGQFYPEQKFSYFVSEILPLLREHLKVDIASSKLPQAEFEQPRIVWNTKKEKHILTVTPVIAYGKPTIALVEKGILKLLGNSVPVRLFDKEQELIQFVSRTYPGAAVDHDMTFEGVDAVEFIGKMSSKRASFQGDAWEDFKKYPTLKLNLLSHFEKDLPVQFSTVDQGGQQKFADPNRVIEAWARDESLVPLLDGGWAQLPQKDLANYGAKIRDLLGSLNDNQEIPRCMFPTITQLYDDLETTVPEEFKHISSEITHAKNLANVIMPKEFKGTLRHYQNDGVKWISQLKSLELGALLADDMGLGKTLQTLCCIQRNTLIIAPTSVLQNWQEEISKFRPDLDCHLYYGPNRIFKPDASVNITSYSILRLDIEHLRNYTFDMVVLDEAQYIKNPKSQAAQASFQLNSRFRIALSGTPVENKLEDMWSLFHFLNKGLLSHYRDFQDRYAKPILAGDLNIAEQLRKRIEPFVMRRLKSEVAKELPPRTDIVRFCVLDEQEREVYDTMLLATKKEVLNELSKGKKIIQALEILLRLRQVACHLALLPNAENKSEYSSKVDLLLECLMSSIENNHKSLVFSQWTSFLDIIEKILIEKNIPFLRIDGQTKNRQEVVNRFQNESTIFVMLMSLKAAGVGLNLTAADHVFITDPWWNPAAENQAADRAHRIGQTNPVIVTRLVAQNTVEEKILLLQEKKKFLADSVVNAQGAQANLNKDDILELLN